MPHRTDSLPGIETLCQFDIPQTGESLRGHRLDNGCGPVGIFVHGYRSHCDGEKSRGFAHHAARQGYAWVRFDQRGHGKSDGSFEDFTVSGAVTDLMTVIDSLAGRPLLLVGSSLGGLVSLQAARQKPARIAGLLLLAPAVRFFERHFQSLPPAVLAAWRRKGSISLTDPHTGTTYSLGYGFFRDAARNRLPASLKLPCPVFIMHGDSDEILPPADSAALASAVQAPAVSTEIVAGGDHRLSGAIPLMCRRLDQLWPAPD